MDKKKVWRLVANIVSIGLIVLLLLPTGRAWLQQGLMKIGFFKPDLQQRDASSKPAEEKPSATSRYATVSFLNDEGKSVRISDLEGKVVFVNFWATWCPPCKAEMPSIQVLKDKFKDNDQVVFLLVEIEGAKEKAHDFMQQGQMDLPLYYPESQIPEEWLGGAIPTTVILDKTGKMATRHEGMADYSSSEVIEFINSLAKINI